MKKGTFLSKIPCTLHEDRTPSLALYSDGSGYCFSCNKYFKDLGEDVTDVDGIKEVEDISASIERISQLPTMSHRGLIFPFDAVGYYIVWPGGDYYKCRRWLAGDTGNKYANPVGISQPWFNHFKWGTKALIVEGEINALSALEVSDSISVLCPGSAGQFKSNKCGFPVQDFIQYDTLVLVADKDSAGAQAVIKLKQELIGIVPDVSIRLIKDDFNSILVNHGKEALKKTIEEMGL